MEWIRAMFGVLGNLTALLTFLFPARGRTERSPAMYHAAIVSCTLWVMYGDGYLRTVSAVGLVMEYFFLALFIMLNHRTFLYWLKHTAIIIVELTCVYNLGLLALTFDDPIREINCFGLLSLQLSSSGFLGAICVAGNILVSFQEMEYQTRRSDTLGAMNVFAAVANCFVWTAYALASLDAFILMSYLAGGYLGLLQIIIMLRDIEAAAERCRPRSNRPSESS